MHVPVVQGLIDRRILVNYRVDPDAISGVLPNGFRPQIIHGSAMAGICVIRLRHIRPRFLPAFLGISSENAAHRIAVQWDRHGTPESGVYVPRRDTSSILNRLAGGTWFPGFHHGARFHVSESHNKYQVRMQSHDGSSRLSVDCQVDSEMPRDSVFESLDEASRFFERGALGYSPSCRGPHFDGLELRSFDWDIQPLAICEAKSSFFDDRTRFPEGSIQLDSALLMLNIHHEWHARESLGSKI